MNKLTMEQLESLIIKEDYIVMGEKTTVCCLTLSNKFEIIGTSACVNPADFNKEIGMKYAREQAIEKIWELEGYKRHS